tara:strand:- start:65 stop:670 length:606 start_codon:yes stop_codon:yes gene_type:complete
MDKIKELLLSLLNYIGESPFRLFTVILLCVLGFGGWIIYSEKDAFVASYRAQQAMPKMNGRYEDAHNFLLKNTTAEMVAILEVNTLSNTRKIAFLSTRGSGRDKNHDGVNVGLFSKNYDNNTDVISLMSGKIPCSPYLKPQSFIGFVYRDYGVNFMCRISVPAEPGVFIGQISVGWKEPPENLEEIQTAMLIASSILYSKK